MCSSDLGIITALGPEDPIRLPGHDIEDFSFTLVSPLKAKHDRDVGFQNDFCAFEKMD